MAGPRRASGGSGGGPAAGATSRKLTTPSSSATQTTASHQPSGASDGRPIPAGSVSIADADVLLAKERRAGRRETVGHRGRIAGTAPEPPSGGGRVLEAVVESRRPRWSRRRRRRSATRLGGVRRRRGRVRRRSDAASAAGPSVALSAATVERGDRPVVSASPRRSRAPARPPAGRSRGPRRRPRHSARPPPPGGSATSASISRRRISRWTSTSGGAMPHSASTCDVLSGSYSPPIHDSSRLRLGVGRLESADGRLVDRGQAGQLGLLARMQVRAARRADGRHRGELGGAPRADGSGRTLGRGNVGQPCSECYRAARRLR